MLAGRGLSICYRAEPLSALLQWDPQHLLNPRRQLSKALERLYWAEGEGSVKILEAGESLMLPLGFFEFKGWFIYTRQDLKCTHSVQSSRQVRFRRGESPARGGGPAQKRGSSWLQIQHHQCRAVFKRSMQGSPVYVRGRLDPTKAVLSASAAGLLQQPQGGGLSPGTAGCRHLQVVALLGCSLLAAAAGRRARRGQPTRGPGHGRGCK